MIVMHAGVLEDARGGLTVCLTLILLDEVS